MNGVHSAEEAIKSQQVAQGHEQLRALHDVSNRTGLQGMHQPKQRREKG